MPRNHAGTITTTEAARLLGLSPDMTMIIAKRGELAAYKVGPRSVLFDSRDVERLAEQRRLRPPRRGPRPKPKETA